MDISKINYRKLIVGDDVYEINLNTVPEDSVLYIILTDDEHKKDDMYTMYNFSSKIFKPDYFKDVIKYLEKGEVSLHIDYLIDNLECLGIFTFKTRDYPYKFLEIKLAEEWDRRNRYNPYFEYYWDQIQLARWTINA